MAIPRIEVKADQVENGLVQENGFQNCRFDRSQRRYIEDSE